jgi:B-cell receptor-associated protein 31
MLLDLVPNRMMHFLSENPIVAKIQYGVSSKSPAFTHLPYLLIWRTLKMCILTLHVLQLKITFIFVAVLFVDAVQRMIKVAQEGQTAKQEKGVQDVRVETNHSARKFYAQRNCEF